MTDQQLVLLIGVAVLFFVANLFFKGVSTSATIENSNRVSSMPTAVSPTEALKGVVAFAQGNGYGIPVMDEPNQRCCLWEPASLTSWGFFHPISVVAAPDGAVVTIGTKSKVYVIPFWVTRSHDKTVSGIRAALVAAKQHPS